MATFNKRIFGTDIHPLVKNKLRARQLVASDSLPGQPIQFKSDDSAGNEFNDNTIDLFDVINPNFSQVDKSGNQGSLVDLSSRTPWVRMWTALQLFLHIQPKVTMKEGYAPSLTTPPSSGEMNDIPINYSAQDELGANRWAPEQIDKNPNLLTISEVERAEDENTIATKVYVIGNHKFNVLDLSLIHI